jgi:hypothetical protein
MSALFSFVVRLFAPASRIGNATIPRRLLEEAEACCGSNPHEAAELRGAAVAYLRVVR